MSLFVFVCIQVPLRGHSRRRETPLNMNHYANKKSAAESMLDVALLMANASQLKAVMEQGPNFTFYVPLITLISISLILQILVGVMLIFIGMFGLSLYLTSRLYMASTSFIQTSFIWQLSSISEVTVSIQCDTWSSTWSHPYPHAHSPLWVCMYNFSVIHIMETVLGVVLHILCSHAEIFYNKLQKMYAHYCTSSKSYSRLFWGL